MPPLRPAGGQHARRPAEGRQLEARVVGEHPPLSRPDGPPEAGFEARVLDVRLAVLGRVLARGKQLDVPAGQRLPHLRQLARVRGAERDVERRQRRHRTPIT